MDNYFQEGRNGLNGVPNQLVLRSACCAINKHQYTLLLLLEALFPYSCTAMVCFVFFINIVPMGRKLNGIFVVS